MTLERLGTKNAPSTLTGEFGEFVSGLRYEQVPGPTNERTKMHLLDTLGCMFFVTRLPLAGVLRALAPIDADAGSDGYTVVGMGRTPSPGDAALVNGSLAAGFELDGIGVYSHPGPCVVGAALTAAEYAAGQGRRISGKEFLLSILIGFEVQVRIADWIGFAAERDLGWHTPAFHGAIGGAAAAARLLGLDDARSAFAVATGVDMAGGGLIHARNDVKRVHTGRAAQTGVIAALLAAEGIECNTDILEDGRWGYYRALRYGADTVDPATDPRTGAVTQDLFTRFDSYDKIALKYYPFVGAGQTIIDNIRTLRERRPFHIDDVSDITIHVSSFMFAHTPMLRPATNLATQNFSFPYAAALAVGRDVRRLTEPGTDMNVFLEGISDAPISALQKKVKCILSPVLDAENTYTFDTIVEVRLNTGEVLQARTEYGKRAARATGSKGSIGLDVLSLANVENKFSNLCRGLLADARVSRILDTVRRMEDEEDLAPFLALLIPHSGGIRSARSSFI
jgi:2-methylcitrate dehydratase PrpD